MCSFFCNPNTLNLMINDSCNSRCKMCLVWKQTRGKDITPNQLSKILNDSLFRNIEYVGVSGGEPTLRDDLDEIFKVISNLKGINGTGLITNGIEAEKVISQILKCNEICLSANVPFNVMVSLDGVGAVHDNVRGRKQAYENAIKVIFYLRDNTNISLSIGCTVVKQNVWHIDEVLDFCKSENIYGRFRIGEFINRLYNNSMKKSIRNFTEDEKYQIALFFKKLELYYEPSPEIRQTYRNIRQMIFSKNNRENSCPYRSEAVGLDSKGNLIFCSPKSPILGSCLDKSAKRIYEENISIRKKIKENFCHDCIHDYHAVPSKDYIEETCQEAFFARQMSVKESIRRSVNIPNAVYENINLSKLNKILIIGWYGTETAGDKAILSAIISNYKKLNPKVKITVASLYPFITERTLCEIDEKDISILITYSGKFLQECRTTDAIIMGGGPLMGMEPLGFVLTAFTEARKNDKFCIIEGCGIGPLNENDHILVVKEILRISSQIRVRDKKSLSWVIKNTDRFDASCTNDPAVNFVNDFKRKWRSQGEIKNGEYFGCFLREITEEYANGKNTHDFLNFREKFESELGRLINHIKEETGLKPLLMPMHTFAVGQDDRDFSRKFAKKYLNDGNYKIGNEVYSPHEILKVMDSCILNVCMRFHSVLFAEQLNTNFISIDYTDGGKVKSYLEDHKRTDLMFKREEIERGEWVSRINNILIKKNLRRLKIVHLCSNDFGGAGLASYRLQKGIEKIGEKSKLLVLNKKSKDSTVKIIPSSYTGKIQKCLERPIYSSNEWLLHANRWQNELNKYPNRPNGLEIFTDGVSNVRLNEIREICDADIINLHWVAGILDYINAPLSIGNIPIVWTLHDMNPFTGGCHYSNGCKKYQDRCGSCPQLGSEEDDDLSRRIWTIKNNAYKKLDLHIVTPSHWLGECASKSSLMSNYPLQVIPNGLPVDIFKPKKLDKIRDELNIDKSANVILFGADNLTNYRKGFTYLLNALNILATNNRAETVLITFGDFHDNTDLKTNFPIYNLGPISNELSIASIYNASDVFVIPSLEDNLPNTAIEAMACGVPIVAFDVGGLSDIIDHFVNGYLAKPRDINDLNLGIQWVLTQKNTRSLTREKCREKAEKHYSVKVQSKKYRELYIKHINDKIKRFEKNENNTENQDIVTRNNEFNREKYYLKIKEYLSKGNNQDAIKILETLLNNYPQSAIVHSDLATLYRNAGEKRKALHFYEKAVELKPDCLKFKKDLAEYNLNGLNQEVLALKIYVEVLKSDPYDVDTYLAISRILINTGYLEDARLFICRAIDLSTSVEEMRDIIIELGEAYIKSKNIFNAKEVYLKYLVRNSSDSKVLRAWEKTIETDKEKEIVEILKSKKKEYLVSAIVSTYNSDQFIEECIKNILSQSISDKIEIVIVNADSEQNEEKIIKKYQKKYNNITYLKTHKRVGIYTAWNIAVKEASGKYLISASTNDNLRKDACEILSTYLDKNPECMLVYGDTYLTKTPHQCFEDNTHEDVYKWPRYSFKEHLHSCLIGPHPMWRKEIHSKIGYFDEKYKAVGDQEFWLRIGENHAISHLTEFTGLQWVTEDAISRNGILPHLEVLHIQKNYQKRNASKKPKKSFLCSIIIPVFNQLEYTKNCIAELYKYTPNALYELIIIDNNSTDGTKEYLSGISEINKVVRNNDNFGYAKACNQGAKLALGKFLVFLNNDTVPTAGWLESMIVCAQSDEEVGIVGSKLLYPDGTIQHAGIEIINGIPDHPLRNLPGDAPEANVLRELDMVTGACVLIKKEIFVKCRGFDEKYRNGVEDVDLCLKVRNSGYKVIYNPKSTLFHHEGKTAGRFEHVRENLEIFYHKWGKRFDKNGKFIQNASDETLQVIWEGSQFVNHSLAMVNREICIELCKRKDIELSIIPFEAHKFGPEQDPKRYSVIQEHLNMPLSRADNVHIRHQWPPNFTPPVTGHWVMIQPWEYGFLPKNWIAPMRELVDEIWVPSKYVREVYIQSGIPADKVFVIPNGVSYENFNNKARPLSLATEKSYKFLFVGGTIPRKGIDVLLEAYVSAFRRSDDVCLVIKDMGADSFYLGQSATELISSIQKDEEAPEILYLKEFFTDKQMAGLYKACDCLVHPYRGEGFGLPVAEAMACGLPVLVTKGGACDDFCNDKNSFLIDSRRRPIVMNDTALCDNGWVLEPDKHELIRLLRFIFENKEEGREIGVVAAREIREMVSWEKSADLIVHRIKELKNKPIIRLQVNENRISYDNKNVELPEYTYTQERITKGDIEGAIAKLEDLIESKPELAVAYNDLGVLYHRQEKNTLALTRYRRAVDLEPGNSNFRKNLADLLAVAFGEYEEALQHYVTVLASDPKDVEALLATGHICARLERYDDAAEFYEKVLETDPLNSDAQNWLAKMQEKRSTNSLELDLNYLYQTLLSKIDQQDLAGAIQKIENFIEMYPKHGQAHNDLGVLYYKNQSKAKVLAHYLKAVELEPEIVTFRKNLADFLYVEEGRVEEALENYVQVLRIKPDDVETLLITGHICAALERFEDAMSFYHKVLNLEPENLDAHQNMEALNKRKISMVNQEAMDEEKPNDDTEINQAEPHASVDEVSIERDGVVEEFINKAEVLFQQERIDQAVDTMLKAIAVSPSYGRTYVELAGKLVNYGRHENALEVLAEMPTNQPVAVAMQKMLVEGYAEEGMGNYAAAKKCSDGVLASEPKNAKALNLNGILTYRNGDRETAEQHFKRAIELDSEYGEPHTNLGALVWENNEPKLAMSHYEHGFSLSPTNIDVANAYHEAVTATGEYESAEKAARSALKKFPQCRKVLYLLIDTLIMQEKNEAALKELETALSTFGVDEGLLDTALTFRERVGNIKKTGSSKKPNVSLCMIVKNEEANLARCLASVKPIVDIMIVVDTGSTDRTRDIAEFFGARVYDFEWNGDFAEARNFSLSKAKGGWVLILDADEVISSKDYAKFRSLVRRRPKKPVAYSITTRNYCTLANNIGWETNIGEYPVEEAGFGWLPSTKVRLFYGKSRIRFEGAVHEMVDPVLKRAGIQVKSCKIPVHHYGRLDTERMDRKGEIYYDIGRRKLEESNFDHAALRELATQATILCKNEEAVDLWHRFLKMSPPDGAVAEAHINLATLYLRLQDYVAARNVSEKVLSRLPEIKEARYNLALSELYLGSAEKTVDVLKRLVEDHPLYPPAQFILTATCFIIGQKEEAKNLLENLKKGPFGPVLTRSFAELVRDLTVASRFDYAQQLLDAALENEIVDAQILAQLSPTLQSIPQAVAVTR